MWVTSAARALTVALRGSKLSGFATADAARTATDARLAMNFMLNMLTAVEVCLVELKNTEELDATEDWKSSEVLSSHFAPLLYARGRNLRNYDKGQ